MWDHKLFNLNITGTIDKLTWYKIKEVYVSIINDLPKELLEYKDYIYPGRFMSLGMQGSDVLTVQKILHQLFLEDPIFVDVKVTGCYDTLTEKNIKRIQHELGLEETGVTGPLEWEYILNRTKVYEK